MFVYYMFSAFERLANQLNGFHGNDMFLQGSKLEVCPIK